MLTFNYFGRNAGAELLGMNRESYNQVALEITHIFHGAWPMNFQSKLSSFGSQIKAFRDLVDLARVVSHLGDQVVIRLAVFLPKVLLCISDQHSPCYGMNKNC